MLDDNADVKEAVSKLALPRIEYLNIPVGEGDEERPSPSTVFTTLKAKLYKPPEYREEEQTQYPLVLHV